MAGEINVLYDKVANFLLAAIKPNVNYDMLDVICSFQQGTPEDQKNYRNYCNNINTAIHTLKPLLFKKFSENYIFRLLHEEIIKPLESGEKLSISDIVLKIRAIQQKHDMWENNIIIYFPVSSIIVKESPVTIEGIELWDFQKLIKQKGIHKREGDNKCFSGFGIKTVAGFSMNAEPGKVRQVGRGKVQNFLDALQFCNPSNTRHDYNTDFYLLGNSQQKQDICFSEFDSQLILLSLEATSRGLSIILPFPDKQEQLLKESGFHEIIELFNSINHTGVECNLIRAIHWYIKGEREHDRASAFMYFTMALEALLTSSGEGIQNKIAESVAFIIGDSLQKRLDIRKKVKELYGIRSKIAHGRKSQTPVSITDVRFQRDIVQKTILFFLFRRDELKEEVDIDKYFEKLKFTIPDT